jgi:hypothetical protein
VLAHRTIRGLVESLVRATGDEFGLCEVLTKQLAELVATKVKTRFEFDYLGVMVYIWIQVLVHHSVPFFIVPSHLFNPAIATGKGQNIVFAIRYFAVKCLLAGKEFKFDECLLANVVFPEFFAEIVDLCILHFDLFEQFVARSLSVVENFRLIGVILQQEEFRGNADLKEAIESARKSFFVLISKLFEKLDILNRFLNDKHFLRYFFSLLFEVNVQDFVLSQLQSHLTGIVDSVIFQTGFLDFLAFGKRSLPDVRIIEVEKRLFGVVNKKPEIVIKIENPWDELTMTLNALNNSTSAGGLILEITNFINRFTNDQIPLMFWVSLEKSFLRLSSHEEPDFQTLLCLLRGEPRPLRQLPIPIVHPFALNLLFRLFVSHSQFAVLDLIRSALSDSRPNCVLAHENGFDICLLDYVFAQRDSLDSTIPKILEIFILISVCISSPIVVQRYILLFHLIESRFISPIHPLLLGPLVHIFESARLCPSVSLPLSHECSQTFSFTSDGVTLTCWFCTEVLHQTTIFSLNSENSRFVISLSVTNKGGIMINQTSTQLMIKPGQWHFIGLTFSPDSYILYLDDNEPLTIFAKLPSTQTALKFTIGNRQAIDDARYGPFACVKPLSASDIKIIRDRGPRTGEDPPGKIFCFSAASTAIIGHQHIHSTSRSFADHFLRSLGIAVLIPLFAQVDLPLSIENIHSQFSLVDIIGVLTAALCVSDRDQEEFNAAHCY